VELARKDTVAPLDLDYAVVVGINTYRSSTFKKLEGACTDADDFVDWLTSAPPNGAGIDDNARIAAVPNPSNGRPEAVDIRKAFTKVLERPDGATDMKKGRRLYIFASSHGMNMPRFDGVAIVPANYHSDERECVVVQEYVDTIIKRGAFREIVVFMDCCRNDHLPSTKQLDLAMTERGGYRADEIKLFRVYSSLFRSLSRERDFPDRKTGRPAKRGVFSYALMEGLRGLAADADGEVTTRSLTAYLRARVDYYRPADSKQEIDSYTMRDFAVVAGLSRPPPTRIQFVVPGETRALVVRSEGEEQLRLHSSQAVVQKPAGLGFSFTLASMRRYAFVIEGGPLDGHKTYREVAGATMSLAIKEGEVRDG